MTTGRTNQVRTIGGSRAGRAPPARVGAGGGAPMRARVPPGTASRRAPSCFVGEHAASARSRWLRMPGRVSPRLGGARLVPGRLPSCPCGVAPAGARQPPACAALSLGPVQAASDARARLPAPRRSAPRAGLGAELPMRGGPARPQPAPSSPGRTASPPPSDSHVWSAGASMRQAVARPRLGRRRATLRPQPACFPWDSRPRGKTPPGYAAATARLTPRARLDATAHWRQDTDAPRPAASQGLAPSVCGAGALAAAMRCHHALCVLTRRGCPILYVPAQCVPVKTEALLPSHFGRGGERPPPPPLPFSGGEERPPTPAAGAVMRDLHFGRDGTPGRRRAADTLADGGQPGAARVAQVRRGVTAAISNWPAAPAAGQPQQARPPVAGGLAPFSHYF